MRVCRVTMTILSSSCMPMVAPEQCAYFRGAAAGCSRWLWPSVRERSDSRRSGVMFNWPIRLALSARSRNAMAMLNFGSAFAGGEGHERVPIHLAKRLEHGLQLVGLGV